MSSLLASASHALGLRDWRPSRLRVPLLLLGEAALCVIIVLRARYTPIDWRAYMQEVEGPVAHGVWDYAQLRGETGPLVYPGGFVYLYAALRALAGGDGSQVRPAQWALAVAYVGTLGCTAAAYAAARPRRVPPWTLALLCISLRVHSIYLLRLFNDGWAMLLAWAAVALFVRGRWRLGCVFYSLGVGVKMNVFLFAPGLLVLLLQQHGAAGALAHIALCALVQLVLGLPFLIANPVGYVARAFGGFGDLQQKWSVNWKCLPSALFTSRRFVAALLLCHLTALALLASRRWCAREGGMRRAARAAPLRLGARLERRLHPEHTLAVLASCNAIGVIFSRSLHFQFYCWYWHSLPLLLWRCDALPAALKWACLALFEWSWSYGLDRVEGTSTPFSSACLQLAHAVLLFAIFRAPHEPAPFVYAGTDALLVSINTRHAHLVERLVQRRGGVSPALALGAALTFVGPDAVEAQLWDGAVCTLRYLSWEGAKRPKLSSARLLGVGDGEDGADANASAEADCAALVAWMAEARAD